MPKRKKILTEEKKAEMILKLRKIKDKYTKKLSSVKKHLEWKISPHSCPHEHCIFWQRRWLLKLFPSQKSSKENEEEE